MKASSLATRMSGSFGVLFDGLRSGNVSQATKSQEKVKATETYAAQADCWPPRHESDEA